MKVFHQLKIVSAFLFLFTVSNSLFGNFRLIDPPRFILNYLKVEYQKHLILLCRILFLVMIEFDLKLFFSFSVKSLSIEKSMSMLPRLEISYTRSCLVLKKPYKF